MERGRRATLARWVSLRANITCATERRFAESRSMRRHASDRGRQESSSPGCAHAALPVHARGHSRGKVKHHQHFSDSQMKRAAPNAVPIWCQAIDVAIWCASGHSRTARANRKPPRPTFISPDRRLLRLPFAAKLSRRNSGKSPESAGEMRRIGVARGKCDIDNLGICVAQKFSGIFKADPV